MFLMICVNFWQKIALYAEPIATEYYKTHSNRQADDKPTPKSYYNAKKLIPPIPEEELVTKGPPVEDDRDEDVIKKEEEERWKYPVEVLLTRNEHFQTDVNMSFSSVHVPTSIYELGGYWVLQVLFQIQITIV